MRRLLHFVPLIVVYLEYQAVALALGFVRFEGEGEPYATFHGILEVGQNFSFYDVPNLVRNLHIISFILALSYFVIVLFFGYKKDDEEKVTVEPSTF